jgi:hypothetical protein
VWARVGSWGRPAGTRASFPQIVSGPRAIIGVREQFWTDGVGYSAENGRVDMEGDMSPIGDMCQRVTRASPSDPLAFLSRDIEKRAPRIEASVGANRRTTTSLASGQRMKPGLV